MEFALVTVGFMAIFLAGIAVWHALGDGVFVDHALMSASHHVSNVSPGALVDVFLF